MNVTFTSTLEGEFEVTLEAYRRSPRFKEGHQIFGLLVGLLVGVVVSLVCTLDQRPRILLTIASTAAMGMGGYFYSLRKYRSGIRQYVIAAREKRLNLECTLQLDESGIGATFDGIQLQLGWPAVTELVETDTRLMLVSSGGYLISAPRYAFESTEAFAAFVAHAKELRRLHATVLTEHTLCTGCGYDLFGTNGITCPECGLAAPPPGMFPKP